MRRAAIAALALLALCGCSTKFEVHSDTQWSGFVNGASVAGSGDATYSAKGQQSAIFQKSTTEGTLSARAKGWHGDARWTTTTAPFGVVSVSTN